MAGKLLKELQRSQPFGNVEEEVVLNVIRTAEFIKRGFEELLKPFNLSATQYNVLRILRRLSGNGTMVEGSEEIIGDAIEGAGVPCKMIAEHMVTRDPDITRLLDRLETRGLITRHRDVKDRRVVSTRITEEGLRILAELDKPVVELHRQRLSHMPVEKLSQLIELLERVRETE